MRHKPSTINAHATDTCEVYTSILDSNEPLRSAGAHPVICTRTLRPAAPVNSLLRLNTWTGVLACIFSEHPNQKPAPALDLPESLYTVVCLRILPSHSPAFVRIRSQYTLLSVTSLPARPKDCLLLATLCCERHYCYRYKNSIEEHL